VAITFHRPGCSAIAQTAKKTVQLFVENGLDRAADVRAKAILDRIKAVCRTSTTLSARDNHLGRFSGR